MAEQFLYWSVVVGVVWVSARALRALHGAWHGWRKERDERAVRETVRRFREIQARNAARRGRERTMDDDGFAVPSYDEGGVVRLTLDAIRQMRDRGVTPGVVRWNPETVERLVEAASRQAGARATWKAEDIGGVPLELDYGVAPDDAVVIPEGMEP
jgi:hypothetical protein